MISPPTLPKYSVCLILGDFPLTAVPCEGFFFFFLNVHSSEGSGNTSRWDVSVHTVGPQHALTAQAVLAGPALQTVTIGTILYR